MGINRQFFVIGRHQTKYYSRPDEHEAAILAHVLQLSNYDLVTFLTDDINLTALSFTCTFWSYNVRQGEGWMRWVVKKMVTISQTNTPA